MAHWKPINCAFGRLYVRKNIINLQFKSLSSVFSRGLFLSKYTPSRNISSKSFGIYHYVNQSKGVVKGSAILSLRSSVQRSATRINAVSLPTISSQRLFHTTLPRGAIPPLLWVLLRPFANVAAVLFGRTFRKMWQKLPQEKRNVIINRLKQKKQQIIGKNLCIGHASV